MNWHAIDEQQHTRTETPPLYLHNSSSNNTEEFHKKDNLKHILEKKLNERKWMNLIEQNRSGCQCFLEKFNESTFFRLHFGFATQAINSSLYFLFFFSVFIGVLCVDYNFFCSFTSSITSLFFIYASAHQKKKIHFSIWAHRQEHWWEAPTQHAFDTPISNLSFSLSDDDRLMRTRYEIEMKRQTGNTNHQQQSYIDSSIQNY